MLKILILMKFNGRKNGLDLYDDEMESIISMRFIVAISDIPRQIISKCRKESYNVF